MAVVGKHVVVALVAVLLLSCAPKSGALDVCAEVSVAIQPCLGILTTILGSGQPSTECCNGLRHVAELDVSVGSNTICKCVHSQNINTDTEEHSNQLQSQCGVNLGFSLSVGASC